MASTRIPWSAGSWTNPPRSVHEDGSALVVEAAEGSDYWQKTVYGFDHGSGHGLVAPWDADRAVEVRFRLSGFTRLYDQAGLLLWHADTQWIKAGVEINDGVPHVGAVVTDGYSDWSLSPVPEWADREVTIRASRVNDGVVVRARADGPWRTIRVARFAHDTGAQAGPFVCAPTRAGLVVAFTGWWSGDRDEGIHADPPLGE